MGAAGRQNVLFLPKSEYFQGKPKELGIFARLFAKMKMFERFLRISGRKLSQI
jgi:hypothetical protein